MKLTSFSDGINPLSPSVKRKRVDPLFNKEEYEQNLEERSKISMF